MRLCFATHNRGKVAELRALLDAAFSGGGEEAPAVLTLADLGVADDVVEDGATFAENAEKKAASAYQRTGLLSLADDSGLLVDALSGAPGVHSARYAGEPRSDARNLTAVLQALSEVPEGRRTARFHCTLCLCGPGGVVLRAAECEGRLLSAPLGEGGFGYDPIFVPDLEQAPEWKGLPDGAATRSGRTLAELPMAEKNLISHRARALRLMVPVILTALKVRSST